MRYLVVGTLGLVVGVGIGYWLSSRNQSAPRSSRTPSEPVAPADSTTGREGHPSGLAAALADLPEPAPPNGAGTITGRIADEDGRPIANARVYATRSGGDMWFGLTAVKDPDNLESVVRAFVDNWRTYQLPVAKATSADDGTYRLSELADEEYQINADADGYSVDLLDGVHLVRPNAVVDFVARPLRRVSVDVRLPDGSQPPKAMISIHSDRSVSSADWTPQDNGIPLSPGQYTLSAWVWEQDELLFESGEQQVEVTRDADIPTVALTCAVALRVYGTITSPDSRVPDMLQARALKYQNDELPTDATLLSRGTKTHCRHRSFQFDGLPPGRYLIGITNATGTLLGKSAVEVVEGVTRCEVRLESDVPGPRLRVTVRSPSGEPIEEVAIRVGLLRDNERKMLGSAGIPQSDGSFLVPHPAGLIPGALIVLEVENRRFGKKLLFIDPSQAADVEVKFGPPATLQLKVADVPTGASLWAALAPRLDGRGGRHLIDLALRASGDGTYSLGPVEAGDYDMILLSQCTANDSVIVLRRRVSISGGSNSLEVRAPALHKLVMTGLAPGTTVRMLAEPASRWQPCWREVGGDGNAEFEFLPTGKYTIGAVTGEIMIVDLSKDTALAFHASDTNALLVFVEAGNRDWTHLGLESGDVIVGVDGTQFETSAQLQSHWTAARKKPAMTLLVLRAGSTLEVVVDNNELSRVRARGGGSIEPTTR